MTAPEHCDRVITYRGADREPIPCGRLRPCPYHDDHNRPEPTVPDSEPTDECGGCGHPWSKHGEPFGCWYDIDEDDPCECFRVSPDDDPIRG